MTYCFRIFAIISSLFFAGCSFMPKELKNAEQLMETAPDSALHILQHISPQILKSESSRAHYGLLLFQALDKNSLDLKPDSVINYSLEYYQNTNKNEQLAKCYFYRARMFLFLQHYDKATELYLQALGLGEKNFNNELLGKIYSDLGDINTIQADYKEALSKYILSIEYYNNAGKTLNADFVSLNVGRAFRLEKENQKAFKSYHKLLSKSSDSLLIGVIYQELGSFYQNQNIKDSAKYYSLKSIHFPYKKTNFSIRNYTLADLYFDIEKYDSAHYYATQALKYPTNYFTRRECFRILVNVEYLRNDIKQMGKYMTLYQAYTDSIRSIELQTKGVVLEKLHETTEDSNHSKTSIIVTYVFALLIFLLSILIAFIIYRRYKQKNTQLDDIKIQLTHTNEYLSQGINEKIAETKAMQSEVRKNASAEVRNQLDIEVYNKCLHINDWEKFTHEMNTSFNQIIVKLKDKTPTITQKEITWCCLELLDISHQDRILILDASSDSLYKLKQRLAHKINLKTTKELDKYLADLVSI